MVVNPCFALYGRTNIAECFTQPGDYFDLGGPCTKVPIMADPRTYIDSNVSHIVIGGGGIYKEGRINTWHMLKAIVRCAPAHMPVIIWGMGINDHGRLDRRYDPSLHVLEGHPNVLIGLRDAFYHNYVPCVSCMRPEFDEPPALERSVGMYLHHSFELKANYAVMSNKVEGDPEAYFKKVVAFLGSSEVVVTNTYHGAYWATLLNRKVVVVAPFANKFMGLKYEPLILSVTSTIPDAVHDAQSYPDALGESRRLNLKFLGQMRELCASRDVRNPS